MNLKLRSKILLGFTIVLIITSMVNIYSIVQMGTLADLTSRMFNHPLQVTRATISAHTDIIKMHRGMKDVVLATTIAEQQAAHQEVNRLETQVNNQLDIVEEWILGDEGAQLIRETQQLFADWRPIREDVISLIGAGETEAAAAITRGRGADHVAKLESQMVELRNYAAEKATGMNNDAANTYSQIINFTTISLIGALIVSGVIGIFLANTITNPVQAVASAATKLSQGDLSQTVHTSTQDEIGDLALAFNDMAANLRRRMEAEEQARADADRLAQSERAQKEQLESTVNQYLHFVENVAAGDLSGQLQVNGSDDALSRLGRSLNTMITSLRDITQQIRQATTNMATAAAEISAATAQQNSNAAEQSAAITQTATTIDEVKNIAEQAYSKAENVSVQSRHTHEVSQQGQAAINETINSMTQIKEKVAGIATNILALSEQTQQIGNIIATVNDIAAQSNLLALNASVEAARAGEHGKGFNVVAVEVRNLAEQSKQATSQVKQILNEIQKATNTAVMSTEEGTKGVDIGVQQTKSSGDTILQLADNVQESALAAQQIVASAQQQATGMEQIALAMQNINQATMQSLASTRQAERAAQDLSALSQQLESVVARYKLN
ncbi:MAG TPA: methyl-accepting chemotaxis protein [Anaerolineae bacterium]|nr:methyl-accepting chemotaxis protein [Anaerolineae bacterium]